MYRVLFKDHEHEIEAEDVRVEKGNLLFYRDAKEKTIDCIVPVGAWEMLSIEEDSKPIRFEAPVLQKIQAETSDVLADTLAECE